MGYKLKKMQMPGGSEVEEKACPNYTCRYCGEKATACNYVADMCLQVYARHNGICGAFMDSEKYVGYVSDCTTCKFRTEDSQCTFEQ